MESLDEHTRMGNVYDTSLLHQYAQRSKLVKILPLGPWARLISLVARLRRHAAAPPRFAHKREPRVRRQMTQGPEDRARTGDARGPSLMLWLERAARIPGPRQWPRIPHRGDAGERRVRTVLRGERGHHGRKVDRHRRLGVFVPAGGGFHRRAAPQRRAVVLARARARGLCCGVAGRTHADHHRARVVRAPMTHVGIELLHHDPVFAQELWVKTYLQRPRRSSSGFLAAMLRFLWRAFKGTARENRPGQRACSAEQQVLRRERKPAPHFRLDARVDPAHEPRGRVLLDQRPHRAERRVPVRPPRRHRSGGAARQQIVFFLRRGRRVYCSGLAGDAGQEYAD